MNSVGIIFDGDDTLWETAPLYARAKHEFFGQMSSLGFDSREVERTFHIIDVANVDRLGFSRDRFPTSMAETYRLFCERHRANSDKTIETAIRSIGYRVFDELPLMSEDAEYVLGQVHPYYKLILATKGDQEIQREKIDQSNLSHFFDATYILDRKTGADLRRIAEESGLNIGDSWIIGDSLRSDIALPKTARMLRYFRRL